MFVNRQQAGMLLAQKVSQILEQDKTVDKNKIIVLALPRGGVPVGLEIALSLQCPLNIIAAKKIGSPYQPELAIGAITSDGTVVINENIVSYLKISHGYIDQEKIRLIAQTAEVEEKWRNLAGLPSILNIESKTVIVVDDGVATGMTAIAAARSLRTKNISKLIFAAPVMSVSAHTFLRKDYDQVITLSTPENFVAVGQFYIDFNQVTDNEVVEALKKTPNSNRCDDRTVLSEHL